MLFFADAVINLCLGNLDILLSIDNENMRNKVIILK